MTTNTSESGLEALIESALTGGFDTPVSEAPPVYGLDGGGYLRGSAADYDRGFCLDRVQLVEFLRATQPLAEHKPDAWLFAAPAAYDRRGCGSGEALGVLLIHPALETLTVSAVKIERDGLAADWIREMRPTGQWGMWHGQD